MNEARFWARVRKAIKAYPDSEAKKLSDAFTKGTADCVYGVNGVSGFLELKYTEWPKRADTTIIVDVSEEQRNWLEDWCRAHVRAQVLLGVGQDWFLIHTHEVPPALEPGKVPRMTRFQLQAIRQEGRAGTLKDLDTRLPALLAEQLESVLD